MALQAVLGRPDVDRVILEEYTEGVHVLAFRPGEQGPFRDMLQDDWAMAKRDAMQEYGVTDEMWHEIPDTGLMGRAAP